MPNELKNALKASTSHVTTNHTMSRQLPVAGSSTVSVMVWTISGIVLAACGGGGGGGAGGSGLSVSGSSSNGDGGGSGSNASGPSGNIARVVDGPVEDAAVYFDMDGDGEISDSERAAQKQNGDPMYITDANGYVNAPIEYEGHFFIANVDNATDTATGDTLSGEYQSLSTGGIATPITDLIADRMRESNADAQGVLDDIFGADGLVTVDDILDAENYKILKLEDEAEKPTLPSDTADAEEQEEYGRTLAKYKTSVIMEASLALSEIDKDDGAFANLVESPTARVNALKQIIDDDPDSDNNDTAALAERISDRVAAGREILGRKPLAQPDSSISPIDEDSVFRFPQRSEDIFGFDDPNGNSDDADVSRFTGIYVKSSVDFSQADAGAHTVDLLYNGSALSGHEVAGSDSLPGNLPPEAGFYYVSSENLSRLSIRPSDDDSGTIEVEYYVFDGEQWSDKASLEITVSPVDDPATDVAVGAQDLTAIDENTDLTGGMKVADLDVTDADGAPHRLVLSGANAGLFAIRNDDELWLVLQEGQTLDFEATPTLTVQVEVSGAPAINTGAITVAVNNVNDNLPVITHSGRQIPLLEGTFSVDTNTRYRYTASDADGGTSRLTLSGDPRERFQIDTNGNLQIKANSEFDYETPADRAITLTITAADSGVGSGDQPINTTETVTIRLRNINDNPPVITQSGRQVPLDEGTFSSDTNTGYSYTVSDADGVTSTLSVSGDPQNRFAIDASGNLQIKAGSEFNYESLDEGAITLTITATDSGVGPGSPAVTDTETVIITFGDVNEAPTATPRASISTNDHTAYALEAVDFGFSDVDAGDNEFDSVIITSLPGAGQGTLALNGASVRVGDAITFAQIDAGQLVYTPNEVAQGQITYNAAIGYRVVDDGDASGGNGLRSDVATLVIAVGSNQSATAVSVMGQGRVTDIDENTDLTGGMKVADLDVTDTDGAPHRLVLSGANAGLFAIRNDDELWLVEGTTLDFETIPTLTVQVEVSGVPAINTGAINVAVNDVNEASTATPRTDISTNDHRAYTLKSMDFGFSDVDAGDSQFHSVIITSLPGQGRLLLNGASVGAGDAVTFAQIDADQLVYTPNEVQPGQTYNAEIGYRVQDDGDGDGTNSLSSDAATLAIRVGSNQSATAVAVIAQGRVTDIDENTDLTGGMKVADLDVTDTDGAPHRLVLSGDNAGLFAIRNEDELWLVEGATLDFETTPTLTVQVEVSGAPAINTGAINVRLNDVNEAPTATPRTDISTNDNLPYALQSADFGFRDVDADDLDDQFDSVIITSLPGAAQGRLLLNGASVRVGDATTFAQIDAGQLVYTPSEVPQGQTYNAEIGYRVQDDGDGAGGNGLRSDAATLMIAVGPNQSATGVAVGTRFLTAIDENTVTAGMKVADLTVTDADGAPHRLAVGGAHAGFFEIRNEDELWLMLQEGQLDYETTPTLTVQVGVSGDIDTNTNPITVAVNNLNDNAPAISLEGGQNQVQNPLDEGLYSIDTDTGYRYTTSDADGGTSTLRVSGDDQDRFQLDASGKLQIKAGAEFDYETPADRAITLTITAADSNVGSGSQTDFTHEVTITFRDVEDNIDSGDAHFSIFSYGRQAISAETGAVLTATEVTPDPDIDAAVYSYQWYHIGAGTSGADNDIAGATSRSYTVADTDEDKRIGVRVRYAENSFQSDGTTPTGTETIAAELPPVADFTKIRDISSEVRLSYSRPFVASISIKETGDHLILYEIRGSSRSVFDTTNPHRATSTDPETGFVYVYEISGVDKDSFMLVQNGSNIYIVSRTGFNYENPTDSDQDNNYEITLTDSTRFVPPISYALTITNDTSEAQVKAATASIIETSSSIKFTSLEDAVRAYSGIDDALLRHSATFGGAVVDGANPHRAKVTFKVAGLNDIVFTYELSGDDVNDVRLVQDGNDVSLITVAGLDYENPADEDEMNTYSVVETITTISPNVPSRYRDVQTTYTLSVTDDISEASIEVYENAPLYKPMEIDSVDLQGYQLTEGYVDNALFTIDAIGQIWWKAAPDYEAPRDGDGDNLYEIELYRTNSTGQTHRVQVDIRVNDLGTNLAPGEEYAPDITITPNEIPDEHLPRDFVQHLIDGIVWRMPATGPLIITYFIDMTPNIDMTSLGDRFQSELGEVLLSLERVANVKFVEVNPRDPDEYNDYVPYLKVTVVGGSLSYVSRRSKSTEPQDAIIEIATLAISVSPQPIILHEFGHALGLAHTFDESLGWPGNSDYRYSPLSIMSYNQNVIGLQPADIEALQFLYGAPGTDFMGAESFAELRGNGFATRFVDELQTLTEIDANTDLTAGIKVAEFTTHGFGTFEIVGDHADFFDLRIEPDEITELWLKLEEGESLENIDTLEVYVRIAEKHAVRTEDITITVNNVGSSGAMGSSDRTSGVVGDADQIKINEAVDEGQSVIANLIDLDLGEIDITEVAIGGGDKDHVQIRQTQNGSVLEFVSAPDYEAPKDDDRDNVYEIILYDDLMSIEVDVTVIDIPEL